MAHYAFMHPSSMTVNEVICGVDETESVNGITGTENWEAFYATMRPGMTCRQTSYNTRGGVHYTDGEPSADQSKALRKNYAGIGYTYDPQRDAFIPPKPDQGDWVLDEQTCLWVEIVP